MSLLYIARHLSASLLKLAHQLVIKGLLPAIGRDAYFIGDICTLALAVVVEVSRLNRRLSAECTPKPACKLVLLFLCEGRRHWFLYGLSHN